MTIAQLVKLLDYISRYETNPYHYPSQYIRLKQEKWKQINEAWVKENEQQKVDEKEQISQQLKFQWNPFKRRTDREKKMFSQQTRTLPESKKQLTQYFLNQLYPVQLKWATSTISHESFTDQKFRYDTTLMYFLQRFPDIYLLMYYPIFTIKKAPIDGEIIMISPIGIDLISFLNKDPAAIIKATNDRTWIVEEGRTQNKIISPLIGLKRTEQIVQSILQAHHIDMPVSKTILSQTNHIMCHSPPYQTSMIGKRDYERWFYDKRSVQSPLKNMQLKAMGALLSHCQTTSVRRPEWEKEDGDVLNPLNEVY